MLHLVDLNCMEKQDFESLKASLGFTQDTSESLASLHAFAEQDLPRVAKDFTDFIQAHPHIRAILSTRELPSGQLERAFLSWLRQLLLGPHDDAFLEAQARVGRIHARIGLPQRYVIVAANHLRRELQPLVAEYRRTAQGGSFTDQCLDSVLDLSLAILLDAYTEHLHDKLRVTERLATIGQLAASIGHELRNPLSTIESSVFLLDQRVKRLGLEDEQLKKHGDRIKKQLLYCGRVITNLLNLARDRSPRRVHSPLAELVQRSLELVRIPSDVVVTADIPQELSIYADPEDIVHVLVNLITNAVQAQPDGGQVLISARKDDQGTELCVQDDGPGVPSEIASQIFDPLFTTKPHGTGLGLALCRRVLSAHGGEIHLVDVESGASFRVWLPEASHKS